MANVDAPNGLKPVRHISGGVVRANLANQFSVDNGQQV